MDDEKRQASKLQTLFGRRASTVGTAKDVTDRRAELKKQFITKKQFLRSLLTNDDVAATAAAQKKAGLWSNAPAAPAHSAEDRARAEVALELLQQCFRDIDAAFKNTQIGAKRAGGLVNSVDSASTQAGGDAVAVNIANPALGRTTHANGRSTVMTTNQTLDKTVAINDKTTMKLKEAVVTVEQTKEVAAATAAKMEEQREQIRRIDAGLDEMDGELDVARAQLTRLMKRLSTDKVFLALAFLLVGALVAIIVYATAKPGQTTVNVPDAVKPHV